MKQKSKLKKSLQKPFKDFEDGKNLTTRKTLESLFARLNKKSKTKIAFENRIYELRHRGVTITPEFKFCKTRRFKADFMLEYKEKQLLIEYEGLNCFKSRHTTKSGYTTDCEKYNLASQLGYTVLRYTAMSYKNVTNDVIKFFGIER